MDGGAGAAVGKSVRVGEDFVELFGRFFLFFYFFSFFYLFLIITSFQQTHQSSLVRFAPHFSNSLQVPFFPCPLLFPSHPSPKTEERNTDSPGNERVPSPPTPEIEIVTRKPLSQKKRMSQFHTFRQPSPKQHQPITAADFSLGDPLGDPLGIHSCDDFGGSRGWSGHSEPPISTLGMTSFQSVKSMTTHVGMDHSKREENEGKGSQMFAPKGKGKGKGK